MESGISKASGKFFLGTLISRFSGMMRDIFLAFFFGSSATLATFMVAFRFAHLFRRFFGESALQGGFIPHFESFDKKKSALLYRDLFFTIFFSLLGIVIFIEAIFLIGGNFFPFFQLDVVKYFSIMLFGVVFISLYGINSSLLKCQKIYFIPSVAPLMFNLTWIISLCIIYFFSYKKPFFLLSVSVVIAFFSQMIITFFPSFSFFKNSQKGKEFFKPKLFSPNLKGLIKPFSLSILGIGAVQLNTALDGIFAKFSSASGPAYLWYAARIFQAPVGLFAIAINTAILPLAVKSFIKGDIEKYEDLIKIGVRKSIFFMLFAMGGILVLGGTGINFLFGRGAFDKISLVKTLFCLYGYCISLVFISLVFIFCSSFYAKKKYKVVTRGSIYSVILNILLNVLFIFFLKMDICFIALATSVSTIFNALYLYFHMDVKVFSVSTMSHFFKTFLSGVLSVLVVFLIGYFLLKDSTILWFFDRGVVFERGFIKQMVSFFSLSFIYVMAFFSFSVFFKISEVSLESIRGYFRGKD